MNPVARLALAGLLPILLMVGCATGGLGTGTEHGIGVGGAGVVNIGGTYYSGIPPEEFQNVATELGVTKIALRIS